MITALKKKFGPTTGSSGNNRIDHHAIRTGGVAPLNIELQKRFAHGVNFNSMFLLSF
jgi:hypothetical protein